MRIIQAQTWRPVILRGLTGGGRAANQRLLKKTGILRDCFWGSFPERTSIFPRFFLLISPAVVCTGHFSPV